MSLELANEEWEIICGNDALLDEYEAFDCNKDPNCHFQYSEDSICFSENETSAISTHVKSLSDLEKESFFHLSPTMKMTLLEEVVFAIENSPEKEIKFDSSPGQSKDDIIKYLMNMLDITDNESQKAFKAAQKRQKSESKLIVEINKIRKKKEIPNMAKADGSKYYFKVFLGATRDHESILPKSNNTFELKALHIRREILWVEIFKKVKWKAKLKEIGCIEIPLQKLTRKPVDEIFELKWRRDSYPSVEKVKQFRIKARIDFFQKQDHHFGYLLHATIQNHFKLTKLERHGWVGQLSDRSLELLRAYGYAFDVAQYDEDLYWWANSVARNADNRWLLNLLENVSEGFRAEIFNEEEKVVLEDSIKRWRDIFLQNLSNLFETYPITGQRASLSQIESMMSILDLVDNIQSKDHSRTSINAMEEISNALLIPVITWWNQMVKPIVKMNTLKDQLKAAIQVTQSWSFFLSRDITFHHGIFKQRWKENFNFLQSVCKTTEEKLKNLVICIIKNVELHFNSSKNCIDDSEVGFQLSDDIWQLYGNIRNIYNIYNEGQPETTKGDHQLWFKKCVFFWLESQERKALLRIKRAVRMDHLTEIENHASKSTNSALDTLCIISSVMTWWQELKWDNLVEYGSFLVQTLHKLCSCCVAYGRHLNNKILQVGPRSINCSEFVVSPLVCYALNNINKLQADISAMIQGLEVQNFLSKLKKAQKGRFCQSIEKNIEEIFKNFEDNLRVIKRDLVMTAFTKISGTIVTKLLEKTKLSGECKTRLTLYHKWISQAKERISQNQFEEFVLNLQRGITETFYWAMENDVFEVKNIRKALNILDNSIILTSFHLNMKRHRTEEICRYENLVKNMKNRLLPTIKLIEKYYQECYEEQKTETPEAIPKVTAIVYFQGSELRLEILMAKDLTHSSGVSQLDPPSPKTLIDSYVSLKLVPDKIFPFSKFPKKYTKKVKASDPAVYHNEFSYDISYEDTRIPEGFLQLYLKESRFKLLGQAFIPLSEVDLVQGERVPPRHFRMTRPRSLSEYASLSVLTKRKNDSEAQKFLAKIKSC